ncbi:hypothetical protein AWV80_11385 [Cupriavidus sp. UYMU48A]|nr:hypothetical protein AWV80_11385 [Cupriavidus sp. UYMU48A]
MNTERYRLVFNVARGMLVAVQECAKGHGKGRHTVTRAGCGSGAFVPVFWFTALSAAMMGLPVAPDAHAQTLPIQVDKGAAGAQPYVSTAANGTPVVNIAPPNRPGGTSVNNFIQYNVGPSGVVVNNSGQNSQTQIAGWVQGNMQLGNNHAGTILQQVTAPNPSQLLGMQEIAGNRASLVIANPAGITCSGCGTINADRFTLTTGRPIFSAGGDLTGFDVRQGAIGIDGQGLSSPQAQVDLLSRAISITRRCGPIASMPWPVPTRSTSKAWPLRRKPEPVRRRKWHSMPRHWVPCTRAQCGSWGLRRAWASISAATSRPVPETSRWMQTATYGSCRARDCKRREARRLPEPVSTMRAPSPRVARQPFPHRGCWPIPGSLPLALT